MKKNEDLLKKIGEADEKYIAESEQPLPEKKKFPVKYLAVGGTAAAAVVLAVALNMKTPPVNPIVDPIINSDSSSVTTPADNSSVTTPDNSGGSLTSADNTSTPKPNDNFEITEPIETQWSEQDRIYIEPEKQPKTELAQIDDVRLTNGGMGFEGISGDALIRDGNFYEGRTYSADTMPVYKNLSVIERASVAGFTCYLSVSEMESMAEKVVHFLGKEIKEKYIEKMGELWADPADVPDNADKPLSLEVKCDGMWINISGNGDISIHFKESIPLPQENKVEYIIKKYNALFQFKEPVAVENIDGIYIFDNAGDDTEDLIRYNLCSAMVGFDEEGLFVIHLQNRLVSSEYLGEYPIISEEEAKQLLIDGKYITTVPEEYLTDEGICEDTIAECRITYRGGLAEKYFLPYYRIWVRLDEDEYYQGQGLYGAYYVPAVSQEYIPEFELWDGRFN